MRRVASAPAVRNFKPCGVPYHALQEVYLPVEGLEAMRLTDLDGLDQAEAAARMGVSRQTFGRILAGARRTVTRALAEGMALRIETGSEAVVVADPGQDKEVPTQSVPMKEAPMKIAITATGPSLDDAVDPRFGRAAGFLIVDPQTRDAIHIVNDGVGAGQGAGIAAAETIAKAGAKVLLTGAVGPKALQALTAAGIKACENLDRGSAREMLDLYLAGDEAKSDTSDGGVRG